MSGDLKVRKRKSKVKNKDEVNQDEDLLGRSSSESCLPAGQTSQPTYSPAQDTGGAGCCAKLLCATLVLTLMLLTGAIYIQLHSADFSSTLVSEEPILEMVEARESLPITQSFEDASTDGLSSLEEAPMEVIEPDIKTLEEQIIPEEDYISEVREEILHPQEVVVDIPSVPEAQVEPVEEPPIVKEQAHVLGTEDNVEAARAPTQEAVSVVQEISEPASDEIPAVEETIAAPSNTQGKIISTSDSIGVTDEEASESHSTGNTPIIQNPILVDTKFEDTQPSVPDESKDSAPNSKSKLKKTSRLSKNSEPSHEEVLRQRSLLDRGERLMEAVNKLVPDHPIVLELRPHLDGAKRDLQANKLQGLEDTTKQIVLILEDIYVRIMDEKENGRDTDVSDTETSSTTESHSEETTVTPDTPTPSPTTARASVAASPEVVSAATSSSAEESAPHELAASGGVDDLTPEDLASPVDAPHSDALHRADTLRPKDAAAALAVYSDVLLQEPLSVRAALGRALCLDALAEREKSNKRLEECIAALRTVLTVHETRPDLVSLRLLRAAGDLLVDKLRFRGHQRACIRVQQQLLRVFPHDPTVRNQLGISYLLVGQPAAAKEVFAAVLDTWPNDGLAKVHLGFILKTTENALSEGARLLQEGLATGHAGTEDSRFFFHLGDALQRLGNKEQAYEVYEAAAGKGMLLSAVQRSLYNVAHLTARPVWTVEQTTHAPFLHILEQNWRVIREEGEALLKMSPSEGFQPEAENLRDKGNWGQLELYSRGRQNPVNCAQAPRTCAIVGAYPPTASCKRGQIKFSVMEGGTHVWPHCGPTNCRLRAHLGLIIPDEGEDRRPTLRVGEQLLHWQEGKVLVFDDSFEHEVWHNGTLRRLVLIVDLWHPDLTSRQRNTLSPV